MRIRPLSFALAVMVAAGLIVHPLAAASAPSSPVRTYVFRPGPTAVLVARMAASWRENSRFHSGELSEIRFLRERQATGGTGGGRAKLLVTPMATLPAEKALRDQLDGRKVLEQQIAEMKDHMVEKNPVITDGTLGASRWIWFAVTDPHPEPKGFPLTTQGVLMLGDVPCSVTILYDDARTRDEVVSQLAGWAVFGAADVVAQPPDDTPTRVKAACKRGDTLACGLTHEFFKDSLKPGEGFKLLTTACDAGSAFACGSLGTFYSNGDDGVPKDEARAMKIYMRGCDAHGSLACWNAASLSVRGRPKDAPLPAQSVAFLERACGYGGDRDAACRTDNAGGATPATYVAAQRQACATGDAVACRRLGWSIETGYGDAVVDVEAARAAYAKSCGAHNLWGCFRQALFTTDAKEQAQLFEVACRAGSGPACYELAQPKYARSAEARRTLLRQACESSIENACVGVLGSIGSSN